MRPGSGPGFYPDASGATGEDDRYATACPYQSRRDADDRMISTFGESQLLLPGLVTGGLAGGTVSRPADNPDPLVMATNTLAPEGNAHDRLLSAWRSETSPQPCTS